MTTTPGSVQVAVTLTSLAQTALQKNWFRRFVSPPLAAQSFATSFPTWGYFLGGLSSNSNANFVFNICFYLWRPSSGTRVGYLTDLVDSTGFAATTSETGFSASSALNDPGAVLDGDVLVLEIWGDASQGMATAYSWTFDYEGTIDPVSGTAISSAASYLSSSVDIPLFTPSTFIAAKNKPILQAVKRAAYWCKHERRDSGLYVPRRRVLLPS